MIVMRRYCSTCGISYPCETEHVQCDVCESGTVSLTGNPDDDWDVSVAYAKALELSPQRRREIMGRRRRFVALGATGLYLDLLVESNISPHDMARLREKGCPAETAARILL